MRSDGLRNVLGTVVIAACCLVAAGQPGGGPPPALVYVDTVRLERVESRREVTGELRAMQRSVLASEVDGLVEWIGVRGGEHAEQGRVIARLDDTRARLDLDRALAVVDARRAIIEERKAQLANARRELARQEDALQKGALTERELDEARTLVASAAARVEQARADLGDAEAQLGLARERLEDMIIEAPYSATVVQRMTEVGQWVSEGDPIAEVVAIDKLEAWLDVPERFIRFLRSPSGESAMVDIRFDALGGETVTAPITSVVPAADPLSRLFPVRVVLDNQSGVLKPGMSLRGIVPTGETVEATTLSRDAVLRNDAGTYCYAAINGSAVLVPVEVVYAVGDRLVVRADRLTPGMRVIVEGNQRVFPGQPLQIMEGDGADDAPPTPDDIPVPGPAPEDVPGPNDRADRASRGEG